MRFHVYFIFLMVHMLSMTRSGQVDLISFVKSSNVHFLMWWFIKFIIASSISIIELDKVNQSLDSFLISFFSLLLAGSETWWKSWSRWWRKAQCRGISRISIEMLVAEHHHHRVRWASWLKIGWMDLMGRTPAVLNWSVNITFFQMIAAARQTTSESEFFFLLHSTATRSMLSSARLVLRPAAAAVDIHYASWTEQKKTQHRMFSLGLLKQN